MLVDRNEWNMGKNIYAAISIAITAAGYLIHQRIPNQKQKL
jgi:hypothetical protein